MYNNLIKFKEFKDSLQISSYRLIDSGLSFNPDSNYISDSLNILRISRSRSFSLVRDYIKSNHFDYFVTMTLKDPIRYDILSAVKLFNDSITLYSKYSKRRVRSRTYGKRVLPARYIHSRLHRIVMRSRYFWL